jgi:CRISPR-associated protein Csx10
MKTYSLQLTCLSPVLIGSGEGFGAVIDADVVFDEVGLPLIPAKRIKGCLLDAAHGVREMFTLAKVKYHLPLEEVFGSPGQAQAAPVYFSNLTLKEYAANNAWLSYFLHGRDPHAKVPRYAGVLSRESIAAAFTELRQQTGINTQGVADEGSLRTLRVLKKNLTFSGEVLMEQENSAFLNTLLLAGANVRHIGTTRTRGLGEVRCVLLENGRELSVPEKHELEAL